MSFTKFQDLTALDVVAVAAIEYQERRFTVSDLTILLGRVMQTPFTIRNRNVVRDLLMEAKNTGLVQQSQGKRGGFG